MLRVALKSVLARKRRLFTTGFAIVLSVAFITGTLVITALMNSTLNSLIGSSYQGIDAIVRSADAQENPFGPPIRATIPASTLDLVRSANGVRVADGLVQGLPTIIDKNGDRVQDLAGPPTLAFNWIDDQTLQGGKLAPGGRPPAAPNEVVIDVRTAKDFGFEVGDQIQAGFPVGVEDVGHRRHRRHPRRRPEGAGGRAAGAPAAARRRPRAPEEGGLRLRRRVGRGRRERGAAPDDAEEDPGPGRRDPHGHAVHRRERGDDLADHLAVHTADPRVRLRRGLRRRLRHLQHLLDRRGTAHARAGAAPSRRCRPSTDPRLGHGRGHRRGHRRFRSRHRARVGSGVRAQGSALEFVQPAARPSADDGAGRRRRPGDRHRLDGHLRLRAGAEGDLHPAHRRARRDGNRSHRVVDRARKIVGAVLLVAGIALIALVSADALDWGLAGRGIGAALLFLGITTLGPVYAGPMARTLGAAVATPPRRLRSNRQGERRPQSQAHRDHGRGPQHRRVPRGGRRHLRSVDPFDRQGAVEQPAVRRRPGRRLRHRVRRPRPRAPRFPSGPARRRADERDPFPPNHVPQHQGCEGADRGAGRDRRQGHPRRRRRFRDRRRPVGDLRDRQRRGSHAEDHRDSRRPGDGARQDGDRQRLEARRHREGLVLEDRRTELEDRRHLRLAHRQRCRVPHQQRDAVEECAPGTGCRLDDLGEARRRGLAEGGTCQVQARAQEAGAHGRPSTRSATT